MSSSIRGWLVFAAMLAGAIIVVQLIASGLESYETRDHNQSQAFRPD